jgi:hypothetical protein
LTDNGSIDMIAIAQTQLSSDVLRMEIAYA